MANIVVCHSRKGGVGKSTLAYELSWLLDAVLVDFEHDGGGVTATFGYRPLERLRVPILDALETGRTPRPLKGFHKPRLVPGHPDLLDQPYSQEDVATALESWAEEWDTDWVVVDTHPGATNLAHGALMVANVVVVPTPLKVKDLSAVEQLVADMADYPIVISPSMVPSTPPAQMVARLEKAIEGTPVQVSAPIPESRIVGTRTKRVAITSETPVPKRLEKVAAAFDNTAKFVREYVQ